MLKFRAVNIYAFVAQIVVMFHFLYALTIIGGLVLVYLGYFLKWHFVHNFSFRIIHLLMILIVAFESIFNIECPLTYIEYKLLNLAYIHHTNTPFIAGFINKILFWNLPNVFFNIFYVLLALVIAISFIIVPVKFPKKIH